MSNILETTLAMLGIEQYIKQFRVHGIDTSVLPLLSDEDLQIIGIQDVELRKRILRQFSTLPTPNDAYMDLTVDNEYMIKVLNNMDQHLLLLNASLSYAYHTKNLKATDIKLTNPTKCLLKCVDDIDKRTDEFYEAFAPPVDKSNMSKYLTILLFATTATVAIVAIKKYVK